MSVFRVTPVGASLLLAFASLPAHAQSQPAPAGREPTIVVDRAACRWVRRHEPAADVEYRPGVDVNGSRVAPADLPGEGGIDLSAGFEIGITDDIARRFGVPLRRTGEAELRIGTVTVEGGRVLFNGRPVGSEAERELIALCQLQGDGRR